MLAPKAVTTRPRWTPCPQCSESKLIVRAGVDIHSGRQKFRCKSCRREYFEPEDKQSGIDYVTSGIRGKRLSKPRDLESRYRQVAFPTFATSLYLKLKLYAAAQGITMQEAAEHLITEGLKAIREGKASNGRDIDVWIVPKEAAPLMKALLQRIEKKD